MGEIKVGDRVRIKDRANWPAPPGYGLAHAEGRAVKWLEYEEVMEEFSEFILVEIEDAEGEGKVYIGNRMFFQEESLEKI